MAVKQHVTESESENLPEPNKFNITTILHVIESLNNDPEKIPSGDGLVSLCEHIVQYLGLIPVPRDANSIKLFKEDINKVLVFMTFLCEPKNNDYNMIILGCLKALYKMITTNKDPPSGTVSMVFELVDETLIPQVVPWMIQNSELASDEMIKKAVLCLCNWLRTTNFTSYLNLWIVGILNGLREQQKFDLLFEISLEVIEPLCFSIIIPLYRANAASVAILILSSIRHSSAIFHKVVPSIPKVLQQLKKDVHSTQHRVVIQNFVDLIAALLREFSESEDMYKDIKLALADFTTSTHYHLSLDVPPWNKVFYGPIVNTNARVGLVNLGNTCYMNSVLQSLVMTKQFSREILLSTINTPLLTKVQQLLALMLHSMRPELTPRDFLHAARPPGFLPGHQQDSSEFLGYLLETLHEQERNANSAHCQMIKKRKEHNYLNGGNDLWDVKNSIKTDSMDVDNQSELLMRHSDNLIISDTENDLMITEQNKLIKKNKPSMALSHSMENTLIQKTFGGQISITHKCLNCNTSSQNNDSFRDLQLSFPEFQTEIANFALQNLLDCYCAPEKLDGDNQYACDECKTLSDGERYINIMSPPKNLILTLKHFKYDQKYHVRAKLMHKVFLNETIFLKMNSGEYSVKYCLYAAVVHSGISMDSGHYYTYAADQPDCWYKFNDSYVTKSSIDDLQNLKPPNTPYILFYRKVSADNDENDLTNQNDNQEETITKKPCLNDDVSTTNNTKCILPALDELPIHLRELVNNDNVSYNEEVTGKQQQQTKVRPTIGRKTN